MIERIRLADFELRASPLLPEPPLLITESRTEFDRIHQALNDDIRPRGITQKMYVADIAFHTWDIARMRRCKVTLINSQFRAALASLLDRLLRQSGDPQPGDWLHAPNAEAENLAEAWFTKPAAKKRVAELLGNFRLDESAIEAEAFRMMAADLERIDRMLASYESRRSHALRNIAEYDMIFAQRLRKGSGQIIDNETPALAHAVSETGSVATSTPTSTPTQATASTSA